MSKIVLLKYTYDFRTFELAIIILIAAGLGIAARLLKRPIILAYIFTGIIIGILSFLI